ncbi:hypothetical protein Godav_028959 [Gossypium davidsonii]|uniref:DUF7745 domain-containing protein n=2 Tax=Gossypium TaxID=3633 RepID=A0A7J8THE3_GOSDV|nr:hypothetical protein [Gossypium davidsonii]
MEKGFLDKVEDNAVVQTWSETTHRKKDHSLAEGYVSKSWDFTRISVTQNSLQELKEIWDQWNDEVKKLFYFGYGDPSYLCFTFGGVDLVPTVEEYMALLCCSKIQVDKAYSRAINVLTFLKKLMNITEMSEQWVVARIKQKGDSKCIPWKNLKDLILAHPDTKKKFSVFALSVYGLVVFPKALRYVDEAVTDLFDRLDKRVTPVPTILAETFRLLNECRRAGEGRFIGCMQLLLAWFHGHFWKVDKVSYRVFSENYSPLKEIVAIPRRDDISKEKWMAILQNLQEEDIEWRAPWMLSDEILYICGDFDWVLLLRIWEAIGYAPLLVLRQYRRWLQEEDSRDVQCLEPDSTDEEIGSRWERKFNEAQMRNESLEKSLSKSRNKKDELKARVAELEKTKSRNSTMELRASLGKIEQMKRRVEELEMTLQNYEIQIEYLEANEDRQNEQFHYFQNQVRKKDHIMGEAVVQIREVADHLQTLAVQVDTLSVKYELESNQGQELASLLKNIRVLSIRAKLYL